MKLPPGHNTTSSLLILLTTLVNVNEDKTVFLEKLKYADKNMPFSRSSAIFSQRDFMLSILVLITA
jgi:hypothetical protein